MLKIIKNIENKTTKKSYNLLNKSKNLKKKQYISKNWCGHLKLSVFMPEKEEEEEDGRKL